MKSEPICTESRDNIATLIYVASVFIMLIIALATSSCNPTKRLARMAVSHPEAAAIVCADMFPVKESTTVRVDTVTSVAYMPPEVIRVNCDSAIKYRTDTGKVYVNVPCPPAQLITHLVTKDSIVRVESTASIQAARNEAEKWKGKYDTCRKWRNGISWYAGILTLLGALTIVGKIWKLRTAALRV